MNCIIGWQCQKINRAKWFAYDLYDTYNVVEPGGGAALKAAIVALCAADNSSILLVTFGRSFTIHTTRNYGCRFHISIIQSSICQSILPG